MSGASAERPVVVMPTRYYYPAYKAGGPVRSLYAMCRELGGEYDFRVIASDRDFGDACPFTGIGAGRWTDRAEARVCYLNIRRVPAAALVPRLRSARAGLLYLNSCFDPYFTLVPLLARAAGLMGRLPALLAPRGELSPGALAQKTRKKELFLRWAGRAGLFRNLWWHASTELEKEEIAAIGRRFRGVCPDPARIAVARNMAVLDEGEPARERPKRPGELRAVFLSRVAPKKNLQAAIRSLGQVRGSVSLDVYGALDPESYWEACRAERDAHAASMEMRYLGAVRHERVRSLFAGYDLFVFPTLGENFGHAILEALAAGCPVLISDRTPWRALAPRHAGWEVALENPAAWAEALQRVADMGEEEHGLWRRGARALGMEAVRDSRAADDHRAMFRMTGLAGGGMSHA